MRRVPTIHLAPLAAAASGSSSPESEDETTTAILDATTTVLVETGLRQCTVDKISQVSQVGRTSIYRRYTGRDALIHAVFAREVRRAFAAISDAVAHLDRFEDRVVEGLLAGLRAAAGSPLLGPVRAEPELVHLITVDSGPLVQVAVASLVEEGARASGRPPTDEARHVCELLVRLATSLVLSPESSLPLDDDEAAVSALHELLDPLLARFSD